MCQRPPGPQMVHARCTANASGPVPMMVMQSMRIGKKKSAQQNKPRLYARRLLAWWATSSILIRYSTLVDMYTTGGCELRGGSRPPERRRQDRSFFFDAACSFFPLFYYLFRGLGCWNIGNPEMLLAAMLGTRALPWLGGMWSSWGGLVMGVVVVWW